MGNPTICEEPIIKERTVYLELDFYYENDLIKGITGD